MNKQKRYASLLILGAGILLFRTIRLLTLENGWDILASWVIILTFIEMAIDLLCLIFALQWRVQNSKSARSRALLLGMIAAIFHAFRVLIYVLGRIGPWTNFDVKPQFQSSHDVNLFWVYFAAILSILGLLGVVIIGARIKRKRKRNK